MAKVAVIAALGLAGACMGARTAAAWRTAIDADMRRADHVRALALDSAGNVLTAGQVGEGGRFAVFKLAGDTGVERWRFFATHGSVPYGSEVSCVAANADDDVIAAGRLGEGQEPRAVILKLSGEGGIERWRWSSPTDGLPVVAVDRTGDVLLAVSQRDQLLLARLDGAKGTEKWRRTLPGFALGSSIGLRDRLRADSAGHFVVSARAGEDVVILKVDGTSGALIWLHSELALHVDLTLGADDHVVCAFGSYVSDMVVAALDANSGQVLWRTAFAEAAHWAPPLVELDGAGDVLVGGQLNSDLMVVKIDGADGAEIWRSTVESAWRNYNDTSDLTVDSAGDIVAATHLPRAPLAERDFAVVKLSGNNGEELWRKIIDGEGGGSAIALALDRRDHVVVAGDVQRTRAACDNDVEYTVVKLRRASGAFLESSAEPEPRAPVRCSDHLVLVTGVPWPRSQGLAPLATLGFVDGNSLRMIATVSAGTFPVMVVAHPTETVAYVLDDGFDRFAGEGSDDRFGTLLVIDTVRLLEVGRIVLGRGPSTIAISPDGGRLYITSSASRSVSIVDTSRNTIVTTIPLHETPIAVAAHPDGRSVYVATHQGTLLVIDTQTDAVRDRLPVAASAHSVTVAPDGRFIYLSGGGDFDRRKIFEVDAATGATVRVIRDGSGSQQAGYFAFTQDGRFALKAGDDADVPFVLNLATGQFDSVECDCRVAGCYEQRWNQPGSVAIWDAGDRAYVAGSGGYAIDLVTRRIVGQINHEELRGKPLAVAVAPCPAALAPSIAPTNDGCNTNSNPPRSSAVVIGLLALIARRIAHRSRRQPKGFSE